MIRRLSVLSVVALTCALGGGVAHAARSGDATPWVETARPAAGPFVGAQVRTRIDSVDVVDDSTYGPAEKLQVWVENTGTVSTRYLNVTLPNGQVFVDDEGQQTFIGNCNPAAFPLPAGASTSCSMYRLLTDLELERGVTLPFSLVVEVFGKTGPKATQVTKVPRIFDPSMFT